MGWKKEKEKYFTFLLMAVAALARRKCRQWMPNSHYFPVEFTTFFDMIVEARCERKKGANAN